MIKVTVTFGVKKPSKAPNQRKGQKRCPSREFSMIFFYTNTVDVYNTGGKREDLWPEAVRAVTQQWGPVESVCRCNLDRQNWTLYQLIRVYEMDGYCLESDVIWSHVGWAYANAGCTSICLPEARHKSVGWNASLSPIRPGISFKHTVLKMR